MDDLTGGTANFVHDGHRMLHFLFLLVNHVHDAQRSTCFFSRLLQERGGDAISRGEGWYCRAFVINQSGGEIMHKSTSCRSLALHRKERRMSLLNASDSTTLKSRDCCMLHVPISWPNAR